MPVTIILPKFGFTLESSTIVQWLKNEGDSVRAGDPICEVTTDKVNMEIEAPEAGTLYGSCYKAGDEVPVTEVICYLARAGEKVGEGLLTCLPPLHQRRRGVGQERSSASTAKFSSGTGFAGGAADGDGLSDRSGEGERDRTEWTDHAARRGSSVARHGC
ncbi:MAG: biotin/lipoyl-containing protein [Anaerolineae bacterium]